MAHNNRCHGQCHVSENREYLDLSHTEMSIVFGRGRSTNYSA